MRLSDGKRRLAVGLLLAIVCGGAVLGVLALSDDGENGAPPAPVAGGEDPSAADEGANGAEGSGDARPDADGSGPSPPDAEPPAPSDGASRAERQTERVVRAYVAALVARDGARVCKLLAPGAIEQVELPRSGGDCAGGLTASIGYRDPRGFPQWQSAELTRIASIEVDGDQARVTATVVTEFADREEPSIEEDVVYLERRDGGWLIAKPSATLYRAIGAPDVPPEVLAPPGG